MTVSIDRAISISEHLHKQNKTIVLVGGCFDILHIGHIEFLKRAKKEGDVLFVLLESDRSIRKLKGGNRPIHTQNERAEILASLRLVDYVICLPELENKEYDDIISMLNPNIIATTANDPNIIHKKRQTTLINAKLVEVTKRIKTKSTTRIAQLLSDEL